jgi:hypothetical protein
MTKKQRISTALIAGFVSAVAITIIWALTWTLAIIFGH